MSFRTFAGLDPIVSLVDEAAAAKGEKITVYASGFVGISKTEGYMKQVNGKAGSGGSASVEFFKKNARKHASVVDSYYHPFWMVVKGWGHPDPDSGWESPEASASGVVVQKAKYSGASSGPKDDFLSGPGKNLKPWAMYKDKILMADDDVPRPAKKEESSEMSTFRQQIRSISEMTAGSASEKDIRLLAQWAKKNNDGDLEATCGAALSAGKGSESWKKCAGIIVARKDDAKRAGGPTKWWDATESDPADSNLTEAWRCQECGKKYKTPPKSGVCSKCGGADIDLDEKKASCAQCGEPWPCSDSKRTDIRPLERAKHHVAETQEPSVSTFKTKLNRLSEMAKGKAQDLKQAKVKRLTPKQLDKQISALWSKVGSGVQVDIFDISKIFKMATDAYGTTGTMDDVEAALKQAITKYQKNAKVQPSGGGPESEMNDCGTCGIVGGHRQGCPNKNESKEDDVDPSKASGVTGGIASIQSVTLDIGEPLKYDMDRMQQLMGIKSRWPGLGDANDSPKLPDLSDADPLEAAARKLNGGNK